MTKTSAWYNGAVPAVALCCGTLDTIMNRLLRYIREIRRSPKKLTIAIVILLLIVFFINRGNGPAEDTIPDQVRKIVTMSVADLSANTEPLPVIGTIQSESEARLRAHGSGEIIGLYRSRGAFVSAGTIIGEIENGVERAEVARNEGIVASREASLAKVNSGIRDQELSNLEVTLNKAQNEFNEAERNLLNKAQDAFIVADNAIHNIADQLIDNPYSIKPQLNFNPSNSALGTTIETDRVALERTFTTWNSLVNANDALANLGVVVTTSESALNEVVDFLNDMATAVNSVVPSANTSASTIDSWRTDIATARSNVNTARTTLSNTKDTLTSKTSALQTAQNDYDIGIEGSRAEDIRDAEAALTQAQASLRAAQSNLEKTFIRSPISGTLNFLPIERGDFVSNNELVAVVSNNDTLEILAYVIEEDAVRISVDNNVVLGAKGLGRISYIAPAIDPETKKIEVRVAINETFEKLFNGETINLLIDRTPQNTQIVSDFTIPLSALKVTFDKTVVFTVDANNVLVAHEVTLGPLVGEKVIIAEGLTSEMEIVTDARGLREGQVITLD